MRDKITELIKNSNHECCMYPDKLADKILEVVEKEYYLIPKEITVPAIRLIQEEMMKKVGYIKADSIEICPECEGHQVIDDARPEVGSYVSDCPTCKGKGWITNGK